MSIESKFKAGKRVQIKGALSPRSYEMWLRLVKTYPTLKRPCQIRNDGLLEVIGVFSKKYILVKTVSEPSELSVFVFSDLELIR